MSPIPKTAPFAADEIDALNSVVGTASPIQRAWLAGFLAGFDAQSGGVAANDALPAAVPLAAEPLTVLYATESGNSEKLAGDVAIGARTPTRNRLHQAPHLLLEVRAGRAQRQIEGAEAAMEVVVKLRRGAHRSVRQLNADIRAWIETWNQNPHPFVWTKTADEILESIAHYCTRINESRH